MMFRLLLAVVTLMAMIPSGQARAQIARAQITIDPGQPGRVFDGVGGDIAGASYGLLYNYPEPQRSQILDYLFKPNYGAFLQVMHVEIGGDVNSTVGAEPSHMHSRDDLDCNRGYQWWFMKEATKRNPDIRLGALSIGAPGWFANDNFYSQDNIDFHMSWLRCAREHGLYIHNMGIWNETDYEIGWIKQLKAALIANGFGDTKVIAADQSPLTVTEGRGQWDIVDQMNSDPALMSAVDIVSGHYTMGQTTAAAKELDKPVWDSEDGPWSSDWGRSSTSTHVSCDEFDLECASLSASIPALLNRNYVEGRMTSTQIWPPVTAYYHSLPWPDAGLFYANTPWSGFYSIRSAVWAMAHTSQFAQPGWRYIDSASGYFEGGDLAQGSYYGAPGSYVTLWRPPDLGQPGQPTTQSGPQPGPQPRPNPTRAGARTCKSRRSILIHLRGVRRAKVRRVTVTINGRKTKTLRGPRSTVRIRLTPRPRQTVRVRLRIRTASGRTVVDSRTYRTCTRRRSRSPAQPRNVGLPSLDYSVVIETMGATVPRTIDVSLAGRASNSTVHVWRTNETRWFEQLADIEPAYGNLLNQNPHYSLTVEPNSLYTITTTTGQHKGSAQGLPPAAFPFPYADDFEDAAIGQQPRYFAAQQGSFEAGPCGEGRGGRCVEQPVTEVPIGWPAGTVPSTPFGVIGDPGWTNYRVSVDFRLDGTGTAEIFGRATSNMGRAAGYRLSVAANGTWRVLSGTSQISTGTTGSPLTGWHRMSLAMAGQAITAKLDDQVLSTVTNSQVASGQAGLGSGWNTAVFDNLRIDGI